MKRRVLRHKIDRQERLVAKGGYHYMPAKKKGDPVVLKMFSAEQITRLEARLAANKKAMGT